MSASILSLQDWFHSPLGQRTAQWELAQVAEQVTDAFGFHALQLGQPRLALLAANRMPNRWIALDSIDLDAINFESVASSAQLACDFTALPFDEASIDLLVMPHALEWCGEASACLREAERVLRPEGRLVLTGFNPAGWFAARQTWGKLRRLLQPEAPLFLPEDGEFIAYRRLRDWLRLLNFEVQTAKFGMGGGANRGFLERMRTRFLPRLGAVYMVSAIKRVPGPKLMRAPKRRVVFAPGPVAVARQVGIHQNS